MHNSVLVVDASHHVLMSQRTRKGSWTDFCDIIYNIL